MNNQNANNNLGFYRVWDIVGSKSRGVPPLIPISKRTWEKGVAEGKYPKPVGLGERAIAWRKSDIHELIERLANGGAK
ncbi:AlpA family phage regulatory protein [Methylobacter sp. Wu1]|uniref:helix-turn-helix transcriptional regulator n=1 Tax=Methylobacter sp. Wu1 TaxID=3119359 RepID=UPI002F95D9E9